MVNLLEDVLMLGLGTLAIGKKTTEALVRETLKKNNISDEGCDSILKSFVEEGKKTKETLEKAVEEILKTRGQSLIPGYSRIEKLEARIDELEKKLAAIQSGTAQ